jgi:hypothetical protein
MYETYYLSIHFLCHVNSLDIISQGFLLIVGTLFRFIATITHECGFSYIIWYEIQSYNLCGTEFTA